MARIDFKRGFSVKVNSGIKPDPDSNGGVPFPILQANDIVVDENGTRLDTVIDDLKAAVEGEIEGVVPSTNYYAYQWVLDTINGEQCYALILPFSYNKRYKQFFDKNGNKLNFNTTIRGSGYIYYLDPGVTPPEVCIGRDDVSNQTPLETKLLYGAIKPKTTKEAETANTADEAIKAKTAKHAEEISLLKFSSCWSSDTNYGTALRCNISVSGIYSVTIIEKSAKGESWSSSGFLVIPDLNLSAISFVETFLGVRIIKYDPKLSGITVSENYILSGDPYVTVIVYRLADCSIKLTGE